MRVHRPSIYPVMGSSNGLFPSPVPFRANLSICLSHTMILSSNSHCSLLRNNLYNDLCYLLIASHSKEKAEESFVDVPAPSNKKIATNLATISKVYSSTISFVVGSPQIITSTLYRRQRSLTRKSREIANICVLIRLQLL